MQSVVERLGKNRVAIEIGLDPAEVDKALDEAYLRVARKVKVPGFRQGKVPRHILEAQFGKEILFEDAADIVIPDAYRRALDEHRLEPIDRPELDVIEPLGQGRPFVFKATVQVLPDVELGKYTGVKAEKPVVEVEEDEVAERLQALREQYAELVLSDREELGQGDFAVVDYDGFIDGEPFRGGSGAGVTIEIRDGVAAPGFTEGMTGMRPGETREIPVKFPADYAVERLAGKEAVFKVTLREIKRKELPELNDEFAKGLGEETLEALTEQVRNSLREAAEHEAEGAFTARVIEQVTAGAKLEVPEILIERQLAQRLESFKRNLVYRGMELDRYLAGIGKTEDELKQEMRPQVEKEVREDLVLEAIAKAEGIEAQEEEVDARVRELAAAVRAKNPADYRRKLEKAGRLQAIRDGLIREKTIKFLTERAEPVPERRKAKKG
ncbi:MAG: trigger factor [Bacteroidota bacterium]